MNVARLISLLEQYDPEAEVCIMQQPHYPLKSYVMGVCSQREMDFEDDINDDPEASAQVPQGPVFIVEGSHIGYGRRDAWDYARK